MTHENDATTKTACWKATILFLRGTLLLFSIIAMAWVHRDSAMILESKNHDYTYSRNIPMVPPHPLPKGMSRRINSAASSHRRAQAKQPPQARIVGGTSTEQNEYPYMVALNDGKPICGGVLITPSIILTAAHCVFQVSSADLGRYDLRKDDGVVHQKLDWSDRRVHPNYNYKTSDNDVGLIKLTEPYYATHYAVPYNSQSTPSDLTVIGWGRMSDNGEQPSILLKAEVNEVSDSLCTERYSSYDTSSMLCASAPGRDSCQGDSGGPLFERETSFIVGIVSFGYDCADPNYPGVYARVNSFEAWIDETVCDDLNPQDCDQGTIKSQLDPSNVANIGTPLAPTRKHRRRSPSVSPTQSPTLPPTSNPTNGPTKLPTSDPTTRPTTSPTERPTLQPTTAPTAISTSLPTNVPTAPPTIIPTWIASFAPSVSSIPSTFTNGVRSATTNSPIAPTSPSPTSLSHVPSPTISMGSLGASSTDHSALPSAELSSIPSSDVASGSNLPSHTLVSSTYTPGVPSETPSSGPRLSNASGPPMSQSILIVPSLTSHTTPPRNEPTIDATPGPTTSTLNSMLFDVKTFDVLVGDNFNALPTPTPVPAECRDTKFWIGSDHHRLDCRWVEQRVHRRCKNFADYCPSVCKKKDCGSYYENK